MKNLVLAICIFMTGCATTPSCYVEAGIGTWLSTPDRVNNLNLVGDVPTDLNLYCEEGNIQAGFYHRSDISRGWPFNDKKEWSSNSFMVKYKKKIN